MQRFAVDEQWYRGYAQAGGGGGAQKIGNYSPNIDGIAVKRKTLANTKRGSQNGGRRGGRAQQFYLLVHPIMVLQIRPKI